MFRAISCIYLNIPVKLFESVPIPEMNCFHCSICTNPQGTGVHMVHSIHYTVYIQLSLPRRDSTIKSYPKFRSKQVNTGTNVSMFQGGGGGC